LHTSRAEVLLHLRPEQRAELVADEPVQHPSRLLSVNELLIQIVRVIEGFLNGPVSDLVECDSFRALEAESLNEVPCDGLAFAVGVCGKVDLIRLGGCALQFGEYCPPIRNRDIGGLEAVLDVHAQFLRRQIAHVAHRGLDFVLVTQEGFERPGLRW
jgi:hypothetical protein